MQGFIGSLIGAPSFNNFYITGWQIIDYRMITEWKKGTSGNTNSLILL
jgi:hypothetical protein